MCGFVGFRSEKHFRALSEGLSTAVSRLAHRGPDDSGLFFDADAFVGLGHSRLSIIDLSDAGRQPMGSEDKKVQIVYNGEIYNFREIRDSLERCGHHFHTKTDTEVILKAYLEWGMDCLKNFIGMFSFAIWDGRINRFFLARDRLGIKPLYYYCNQGTLLFASELKALMAYGCFERRLDGDALPLFLHYAYIPAPRTVFKHTYKLLPGHYLEVDGARWTSYAYWSLSDLPAGSDHAGMSEGDRLNSLDELITQAVSDRLVSDVPLGALLSGGIDSSLIVALMQKVNTSPVQTFSIGFREPEYNEAPWAARVADHLGTNHTEFCVTPEDALAVIPRLPEIYDEPFADASAIPSFLVFSLARSRVTVGLSGDGGDEQFAGYVRYWSTHSLWTLLQGWPLAVRRLLAGTLAGIPHRRVERSYARWFQFMPARFQVANFPDKWQKFAAMLRENGPADFYRRTICLWPRNEILMLTGRPLPESAFEATFRETEGQPLLSRLMRVDQKTYLPDAMLTKVDRASMAVGLEVRVPLLDHRIVAFTSQLSNRLKYRNGTGKYLLKRLLSRYVPSRLFERPKMGFAVPIDQWFRTELRTLLLDYLSPGRLRGEGLFDHAMVERTVQEHLSGRANHQYRLWALLMWEMWRERWLSGA